MLDMYVGSSTIVLQFIPANCLRTDLFSNVDRWINEQHLNRGGGGGGGGGGGNKYCKMG